MQHTGILTGAVLGLLAFSGCTTGRAAKPAAEDELVVRRAPLHERFVLSGELAAVQSDPLVAPRTPMWQVRIRWMEQDGAPVKAGQKVLEFDNAAFAGSLEQKRIARSQADNTLAEHAASREVQRADKEYTVEEKRIAREKAETKAAIPEALQSRREWQEAQLALEKAKADEAKANEDLAAFQKSSRAEEEVDRIALAKATREIEETEAALEELVLRAPRDGILILGDNRQENRKFQVGDSTWPGNVVMELPDLSQMRVDARLWDVDDGRIAPSLPVRVTLDAFPEKVFKGRVESVAAVAQETSFRSMRRAFTVRVALEHSDPERMRPGMSAKVEVLGAERPTALLVPRAALDLSADPPVALLADGGTAKVALGTCTNLHCEVTSGLREGQALREAGMRRAWLGLAAVPVLGVSTWLAVADPAKDAGWTPVLEQDLVLGADVTGTLRAVESSGLGPPRVADMWDFKISFMAPEGKEIKAGTPVLGFDDSDLQRQLQEKMAEAEAAGRELDKRRADLDLERKDRALRQSEAAARKRKADLQLDVPPDLISAKELSDARRDKTLAEEELRLVDGQIHSAERSAKAAMAVVSDRKAAAEARVAQLQQAIASMQVTAPRDGTVVYAMNPWSGEKKKPGDSCWQGETVLEIPDLRSMKGDGEVDEADAGRVEAGQAIIFHLDAHPEVPFRGTVSAVHRTVQQQSWRNPLKVVRLDVALASTDPKRMRPGMRFRGKIELERVAKARVVPAEAVFPSAEGPVVYRKTWLGWEPVKVEVGRRNNEFIEVKGVGSGDQVARTDLGARARRAGSAG